MILLIGCGSCSGFAREALLWLPFGGRQLGPSPLLSLVRKEAGPQVWPPTAVIFHPFHLRAKFSFSKLITKILRHTQNYIIFASLIKSRYHFHSFTPEGYCRVACCQFFFLLDYLRGKTSMPLNSCVTWDENHWSTALWFMNCPLFIQTSHWIHKRFGS